MSEKKDGKNRQSPDVPAGFTFLGQFIDHDITLDTTSSLERQNDPEATRNFRTPVLELDSVYGQGPEASPFLYDQAQPGHLLVGNDTNPDDLPRNSQNVALIGDPRNDENGLIAQLHLAFLRFHNKVYDLVKADKVDGLRYYEDDFEEAQRLVRWHYQWIIVHEYLPKIIQQKVLDKVWAQGPKSFHWKIEPFMPVEFSVAAFRFGHSQIRSQYQVNDDQPIVDLFPRDPNIPHLSSFAPVPTDLVVDWRHFFDFQTNPKPQLGRRIDTKVAAAVFNLPFVNDGRPSLPLRNLLRSQSFELPSGEAVAHAFDEIPLTPVQLGTDVLGIEQTPLWFYLLKEAELLPEDRLGPVGGGIVAQTFLGLLKGDSRSYLRVAPGFTPLLPSKTPHDFTIADLITLAES
ncbi:MAG: heme peroxidase family protein [Acidobacteriota bacterium]